jgi:hypothetical protein
MFLSFEVALALLKSSQHLIKPAFHESYCSLQFDSTTLLQRAIAEVLFTWLKWNP